MRSILEKRLKGACFLLFFTGCVSCASPPPQQGGGRDNPLEDLHEEFALEETSPKLPKLVDNATLEDCLQYAALNNAGLKAAFLRWKAALEKIPQERSLPDPRFTYAYFIQEVETRAGAQKQKLGLSQVFPWLGKLRLRGDAAAKEARAQKDRFDAARLELFYRVKNAYHEYAYLEEAIQVTRENLLLVKDLENVVRTWYTAGVASHSDLVRAQVELGKLEDRLWSLKDLREPTAAKLNAALNRPADAPLPVPRKVPHESVSATQDQLLKWMEANNPELKALGALAEREARNVELAGKNFFPDFTVGMEFIDTGEALQGGGPDSGKDPVIASVSVNVPVWRQKYKAAEQEARARRRSFLEQQTDKRRRLEADLKMAYYEWRDAQRKMDLYQNALIPKAEQSLSVTFQSYETGEGTFSDLVDTLRSLLEFQLAYERAWADRHQKLARLEMLVGRDLSAPGGKAPETEESK